ncbi:MAG: ribosomal L7Ae/L30e/S12e/Gadd45 family protein [Lachnospiraceae bacterium]|nr:ribosomal L7Ae/L30e/S12e/Gadd45 family protein [Lachnospiraceae bacterium]
MNDRILSLLGLATKAGSVVSGEFQVDKAVKDGKAYLVIVAKDASANTHKEFRDMCSYYRVPFYEYATKEELGHGIGKEERASVAVTGEGFAKSLIKLLDSNNDGHQIS